MVLEYEIHVIKQYKMSQTLKNHNTSLRTALQASTTELSNNNIQKYQRNQDAQCEYLAILPPHLPSHRPRATSECSGLRRHGIGLVHKQLDALPTAQNLLHILDHNILNLVELRLGARDFVRWRGSVVGVHEGSYNGRKSALNTICGSRA